MHVGSVGEAGNTVMPHANSQPYPVPNEAGNRIFPIDQPMFAGGPFGQGMPGGGMAPEGYSEQTMGNLENTKNQLENRLRALNREEVLEQNHQSRTSGMSQQQFRNKRISLQNQIADVRLNMGRIKEQFGPRGPGLASYAHGAFVGPPALGAFPGPPGFSSPFFPVPSGFAGVPQPHYGGFMPFPAAFGAAGMGVPMHGPHGPHMFHAAKEATPSGGLVDMDGASHRHAQQQQQYGEDNQMSETAGASQQRQLGGQTPAKFHASAPEFVPSTNNNKKQPRSSAPSLQSPHQQPELKERSTNIVNSSLRSEGPQDAATHLKPSVADNHHLKASTINLDGTGVQPRQSHAIQIKDPQGHPLPKPDPQGPPPIASHSASTIAKGPEPHETVDCVNDAASTSGATSWSARTEDFFPIDPHLHSIRNFRSDPKYLARAALWMSTKDSPVDKHVSPSKPASKVYYPEESPDHSPLISPAAVPSKQSPPIVAQEPEESQGKAYQDGFRCGLTLGVAPQGESAQFMKGYRDGVIQAASSNSGSVTAELQPRVPTNTAQSTPLRRNTSDQGEHSLKHPMHRIY